MKNPSIPIIEFKVNNIECSYNPNINEYRIHSEPSSSIVSFYNVYSVHWDKDNIHIRKNKDDKTENWYWITFARGVRDFKKALEILY